ncbi:Lsr2 family DNA-binding protein [Catenulispora rubra]|uniref:Lsr2 family DNA-binding protein n=1 Tax=Catenulispora rubra TaxID=280293 RepID=UPI003F69C938
MILVPHSIESNRIPVPIDPVSVRAWACSQGLDVADRGRMPSAVVKARQAAQRE